MKTQTSTQTIVEPISQEEIDDLKTVINLQWDEFYTADELATDIEKGFIFGKYATNKHYLKEFIHSLIEEVAIEKNTPPAEEIIEETPFFEPLDPIIIPE